MTYATIVYVLAAVTLASGLGFGIYSWMRAKKARDRNEGSALAEPKTGAPRTDQA